MRKKISHIALVALLSFPVSLSAAELKVKELSQQEIVKNGCLKEADLQKRNAENKKGKLIIPYHSSEDLAYLLGNIFAECSSN